MAASKIATISVAKIDRREDQPREHFDPAALAELATSISERGLLQPPVVRKKDDGRFELVMGERRIRAIRELGWNMVQVRLTTQPDDVEAFIDALTENIVREDMTPMEEARGYGRLLNEAGMTAQEIAAQFGKPTDHVTFRLNLLALIPGAQGSLDRGEIKRDFAVQLSKLNPANQARALQKYLHGDFSSETEAVAFIKALLASESQVVIFGDVEDDSEEAVATRKAQVKTVDTWFDKLAKLTEILDEIAAADAATLHTGLAGMVGPKIDQLGAVAKSVRKAQGALRAAKAHGVLVAEMETSDEAGDVDQAGDDLTGEPTDAELAAIVDEELAAAV